MIKFKYVILVIFGFLLVSCGGEDSDDTSPPAPTPPPADVNAALPANGGAATASYDPASAPNVIDDDVTSAAAWNGIIPSDTITVTLSKSYQVGEITVYTPATNSSDTKLSVSGDGGVTWTDVGYFGGGGSQCFTMAMGSGRIKCGLNPRIAVTNVRYTVLANPGTTDFYEIQVLGY